MKIDSSYKPVIQPLANRPKPAANAETPSTTEAVSLSPLAGALQVADKAPVNSARIQEIKDAIAQGRFKINPEAIAGRLIDTARDLVSAQQRQA